MTIKYTGENQELLNKPLPYVYVGERRSDGKIYIGARCANVREKRNVIDDFGIKYFTSSPNVIFDEFDWEILYIGNTKEEVFEFEGELIDAYLKAGVLINQYSREKFYKLGPLTEEHKSNISKGNKGKKGKPHSDEAKLKMSLARKKYFEENPEAKLKVSNGAKKRTGVRGKIYKTMSDESKANISKGNKGKKHSEETKRKISETLKGKNQNY